MKKLTVKKYLSILFLFAIAIISFGLFTNTFSSYADSPIKGENVFPNTNIEYYELTSPTDVLFWGNNIAITENPKSVKIFNGDEEHSVTIPDATATTVGQLNLFNGNYLLVLSNNKIYKIDLSNFSISYLTDNEGAFITCTYYAVNDNYLITSSGDTGSASIYTIESGVPRYLGFSITGISGNKPIAISGEKLIYVKNERIYAKSYTTLEGENAEEKQLILANPDNIICDGEYIYYNLSSNIHRFSVSTLKDEVLAVSNKYENSDKFQLGIINTITDILIIGDKLYITDNIEKTICEYKIESSSLSFTGYAICKGKTAYNRIGNAKDIERRGDYIAVLDEYKLSIINTKYTECYEPQRFTNILIGNIPSYFALGTNSVIYVTAQNQVKLYRYLGKDKGMTFDVTTSGTVGDIAFKCGKYYLLTTEGLTTTVFTILESDLTSTRTDYVNHLFDSIEVDIAGNFYMGDGIKLYKNDVELITIEANAKVITDFSNNVFKCVGGSLYQFDNVSAWTKLDILEENISSFSLDFDAKAVLYVVTNEHYIYSTTELNNTSIDFTSLPADYKISGRTITSMTVKTATILDNSTIFNVGSKDGYFTFNGYGTKEDNYIYVCDVVLSQTEKYICLTGKNGLVLVRENFVTPSSATAVAKTHSAFVTTSVHAYYIPLITLDSRHQIDTDTGKLKLEKHSQVSVLADLTIFGEDFYIIDIGQGNTAFLPVAFTTKVLTQNKELNNFTTRKVENTTIYFDKQLTQKYISLNENDTVKLYNIEGDIATILISNGDGYIFGYIDADCIIDVASVTTRNLLIVILVLTCAVSSAIFFVIKKKSK